MTDKKESQQNQKKKLEKKSLLKVSQSSELFSVPQPAAREKTKVGKRTSLNLGQRQHNQRVLTKQSLEMTRSEPNLKDTHKQFPKLNAFIKKNVYSIQKLGIELQGKLTCSNSLTKSQTIKNEKIHHKILNAFAINLVDVKNGKIKSTRLGVEIAQDAVKDNLTIEETVSGTLFLKQAILNKIKESELFKILSTNNLLAFSIIIENFFEELNLKIAFTYHHISTEKLQNSEARFRSLTEKSADAIALVNKKGSVLHASSSTKEVMGYTAEEFLKLKNPFALVPTSERRVVTMLFQKLLKKPGSTESSKYQINHKGGYKIWVKSVMTNLLKDPNINAVVINYSDITDTIIANDQLKKSEERFRALVDASSDAIYRMNSDWSEMIELQGRNFLKDTTHPITHWQKKYTHKADCQLVEDSFKYAVRTKSVFELEYRVKQSDATLGWILSRAVPILDTKGNIIEWFGSASNITAKRELEHHKDNFLGIVSHELITPVTSLKAYTQVLETRFNRKGDADSALLLGKMDAQVNRLTNLITELLDVTKIHSGKLQFHEQYFNFNELVREKVGEMARLSEKRKIVTQLEALDELYGDRERLGQVLINFLSNAMKYSPVGSTIVVKTASSQSRTWLCVQDHGLGIPKKNLEHVFEEFFRINESRRNTYPGLGLGLYISREIIKRQGGKIWVDSTIGKGSTFCFSLPLKN